MLTGKLIHSVGGKFSNQVGIDLSRGGSDEIFNWFLASKLFGARISTNIAMRTYREFEKCRVNTPAKILKTGWAGLVKILDHGGYVRYDFSTATKLLAIMKDLKRSYKGDLNELHHQARDEQDLENRLKGLGKGIGDVTVNIFLRELRTVWPKARPQPSEWVRLASTHLGLIRPGQNALEALEEIWSRQKIRGKDFCDFEAALLRLGKDYCKKLRCEACPMRADCTYPNVRMKAL